MRVKGPEAAVAAAVAAITTLCGLDKAKATVPYDERALAGFLGKNGSVIRSLAEELKVTITLNRCVPARVCARACACVCVPFPTCVRAHAATVPGGSAWSSCVGRQRMWT